MSAAVLRFWFAGLGSITRKQIVGSLLAGTLEREMGQGQTTITGVREPWKGVCSNGKPEREVHRGHHGVVFDVGIGVERGWY